MISWPVGCFPLVLLFSHSSSFLLFFSFLWGGGQARFDAAFGRNLEHPTSSVAREILRKEELERAVEVSIGGADDEVKWRVPGKGGGPQGMRALDHFVNLARCRHSLTCLG